MAYSRNSVDKGGGSFQMPVQAIEASEARIGHGRSERVRARQAETVFKAACSPVNPDEILPAPDRDRQEDTDRRDEAYRGRFNNQAQ